MRFHLRTLLVVFLLVCVSAPWWETLYEQWRIEYERRNWPTEFGNGPRQIDEARAEQLRQMWGTAKQFKR